MVAPDTLLLATENSSKAIELTNIFERLLGREISIITMRDLDFRIALPEETGNSFCEIAIAKASAASLASGLPSFGDDSGLCVDALGGAPGIRSRRWTGEYDDDLSRNHALIDALAAYPDQRQAAFVTCAAIAFPGAAAVSAIGECRGTILDAPRGNNGFGYDPIFEVDTLGLTLAELSLEDKNAVSHRRRAVECLLKLLGWISV
jgi:XTP/dITP diphosphohydrolase